MNVGPSAAVIGSGFGGLAAAIRLQSAGFRTVIFEKRDMPGGRAYVYRDQGFTFDAGPTVITAPGCLEDLFTLTGRSIADYVTLKPVAPFYKLFWEDGYRFDYSNDDESTFAQIQAKSPGDVQGYKEFLEYTEAVFRQGYEKLVDVPFLNIWSMVRISPQLVRLGSYRSVYQSVSKYIEDPHLRQALSFHSLLVGGNPFTASSIYTLIHYLERKWGVWFPVGGTGALVSGLVRLFEELGGEVRLNSEIESIQTQSGRVAGLVTGGGDCQNFDIVVSNADVVHTYEKLLGHDSVGAARARRLKRMKYSMSLFLIYFGTRKHYPELEHHNVIFGPRYKALLSDIFDKGVLARDFSLYLHAPTYTDPSLAPPGCHSFYVLSPVPHLGKAAIDWGSVGPQYAEQILAYLEKHYMPGLREDLVTQRIFTPLDFQQELNAHLGSAFSLEPRLTQSAYFRVHNRDPRIRGLYFVGAGTHPGAGIPGVVNSGKATAGVILEDFSGMLKLFGMLRQAQHERKHLNDFNATSVRPERVEGRTKGFRQPAKERAFAPAGQMMQPMMPHEIEAAVAHCETVIREGSKSFALAARLFDRATMAAAFSLYGWCRYCDDQIDLFTEDSGGAEERLGLLRERTESAFAGHPQSDPVFIAFQHVTSQYAIPSHYPLELLEGMAMDVRSERYETLEELLLYCYRVAGTVGLMMAHVMGVSDEKALRHAAEMGTAMQLTNIARDIIEDAEIGRVYLPLSWLEEAALPVEELAEPVHRATLATLTQRLLTAADVYYGSGRAGIRYLPFRCGCAVAAAQNVYREIGRMVLQRGSRAWDDRTYTSKSRKVFFAALGVGQMAVSIPSRLVHSWAGVPINTVWRFPAEDGRHEGNTMCDDSHP